MARSHVELMPGDETIKTSTNTRVQIIRPKPSRSTVQFEGDAQVTQRGDQMNTTVRIYPPGSRAPSGRELSQALAQAPGPGRPGTRIIGTPIQRRDTLAQASRAVIGEGTQDALPTDPLERLKARRAQIHAEGTAISQEAGRRYDALDAQLRAIDSAIADLEERQGAARPATDEPELVTAPLGFGELVGETGETGETGEEGDSAD